MDDAWMRSFGRMFWLALLSVYLTDFVATDYLKEAVARPRPLNGANKPWNEQVRIIPDEVLRGNNSYPSGHTSSTFALLTPYFWYTRKRKVRAGLMTWCVLQGFSRVYTAAHFPFCCLMGALLGFGVGTLVFFTLGGPALRKPGPQAAP
jgi:membrane-associated phospholipid phosphatase